MGIQVPFLLTEPTSQTLQSLSAHSRPPELTPGNFQPSGRLTGGWKRKNTGTKAGRSALKMSLNFLAGETQRRCEKTPGPACGGRLTLQEAGNKGESRTGTGTLPV
ncbi:unnamed protein product [Gulo gulo]|uniref:Uncharacterized protein n=1 Tax=Gulo gulo TaxID=48420 RepID=A0A9X9QA43_GULGU|nr:unnamed protein product [Gulo gulo]